MDALLSAHEIGDGLPVLIIHGWEMQGSVEQFDFEPIFTKIPGLRRIYVDLPGMGSSAGHNIRSLDDIFSCLVRFVDARLGTARFLVVGSSCGGYLARALVVKYREQVDGLVLRVPLVEPDDTKRDLDVFTPLMVDEAFMATVSDQDRRVLGNILVQTPSYVDALKAKYVKAYLPAERAADSQVLDPIRADPSRYRLSGSLDNTKTKFVAPTLIVCGRQDESVGFRDSLRLLELYTRSTYVVLDRAGHDLPVGDATVFEALVRDWISRVHGYRACADR